MRKLRKLKLGEGSHQDRRGHCAMEYIATEIFGYEEHRKTDYPKEVSRNVARFVQNCNDSLDSTTRQRLHDYVERIATCAPFQDAIMQSRLDDLIWSRTRQLHSAHQEYLYGGGWPNQYGVSAHEAFTKKVFQLLEEVLDGYDAIAGRSWHDRPLPEIPPLMEQFEEATQKVEAVKESLYNVGTMTLSSNAYFYPYEPSLSVKAKSFLWEKTHS